MTELGKAWIVSLRKHGDSYGIIAQKTELNINSIKSYCKRNGLGEGVKVVPSPPPKQIPRTTCKFCGEPLVQNPKQKSKQYCSAKCRQLFWKAQARVRHPLPHNIVACQQCGTEFDNLAQKTRKYCSMDCYMTARFGKPPKRKSIPKKIAVPVAFEEEEAIGEPTPVLSSCQIILEILHKKDVITEAEKEKFSAVIAELEL
ncbi:MAG: hypothetical protein LBQ80_05155 [Clostridium sp.]|jgi:RNase P subunit RPR2|nr:hypothetical protein [Clostridium sp.]